MPDSLSYKGSSIISSSISLVKTIIGAGLLSIPYAYSTDGTIVGTIIILVAALTSGYGLFLQGYVARYVTPGYATFFNLCSITYPSLSVVFDIAIAVQCFGCAVSYLILIGDLMPTIVANVPYVAEDNYRTFWIVVSMAACVPLSFLKNLASLKYTSVLGLVAIMYMCMLVVIHYFVGDVPASDRGDVLLFPPKLSGVFSTFSIAVFAFTGHQNMFSIINEASDRSLKKITQLVNIAISISSVLFIIVGLAGYLTFGDNVNGNIIMMYRSTWSAILGRLCIVFMVIFSFPLMLHPARISVNNIYYWCITDVMEVDRGFSQPDTEHSALLGGPSQNAQESDAILEESSKKINIVPLPDNVFLTITTSLLVLGYILAICITSFSFILAIVGATGSTAISFILPGLFGHKLIGCGPGRISKTEILLKYLALSLVFWGLAVMILCLYSTLFLSY